MNSGIRHLPNILTVTRIVLVFPFVWFMFNEQYDRALWTLLLAGVSDGVDGFLARQ
ncbi:MAG: CDP-alcohol phosphatidyltransferase family protein, partial [Ketobacter sp.]